MLIKVLEQQILIFYIRAGPKFNTIKIGSFNLFSFNPRDCFVLCEYNYRGIDYLRPSLRKILKERGYFQKIIDYISESVTKLPNFTSENFHHLSYIISTWRNFLYDTIIYEYFANLVNEFRFYFIKDLNTNWHEDFLQIVILTL